MDDRLAPPTPHCCPLPPGTEEARRARQAREAAALRENLRKRRLQAQQRSAAEPELPPGEPD